MSLDPSLKIRGALSRHRNVLSRAERIEELVKEERWEEGDSIMGLPKVAHRKARAGKKTDDDTPDAVEGEVVAEGAEATEEKSEQGQ